MQGRITAYEHLADVLLHEVHGRGHLRVVHGDVLPFLDRVGDGALAGAAVLYDTSNIMHHYPADKHVAASLALFSSIALMFWYILINRHVNLYFGEVQIIFRIL